MDTWADYSVSDRAAIRQQMQLHGHGSQGDTTTDAGKVRLSEPLYVCLSILLFLNFYLMIVFLKASRNIETVFETPPILYTT